MKLLPHQKELLDRNPEKHLIAFGTGTGKTILGISLAEKNCKTCLVVVPKMLKERWIRDTETRNNGCVFTVLSKEEFKKSVPTLQPFDGIIVDEVHFFASLTSALSKRLYWYLKKHNIKYRWLMTATPYLSSAWNIFTLARHLGYEWNYQTWKKQFFYEIRMGHRMIPKQKPNIEKQLAVYVQQIGSVISMEEVIQKAKDTPNTLNLPDSLPDHTFQTVYFDLTEDQKKGIQELDDAEFITRWTHTHIIENGLLYSDGYSEAREFDCKKTDYVMGLCKKHDKIILFCRYNGQIEYLKNKLEGQGKPVYVINGAVKDRDNVIMEAEKAPNCILIIQSQVSAGYELPSFRTMVFVSLSFSLVDHEQALGRNDRVNALAPNTYIYLVVKGLDLDVYTSIMNKKDFSLAIYGKL